MLVDVSGFREVISQTLNQAKQETHDFEIVLIERLNLVIGCPNRRLTFVILLPRNIRYRWCYRCSW
ncbi:hypothetical protein BK015_18105 [Burkholderia pseudomallei]|nr:hypothetical protein BK015_18105 [Burkholderia pseudomallei]